MSVQAGACDAFWDEVLNYTKNLERSEGRVLASSYLRRVEQNLQVAFLSLANFGRSTHAFLAAGKAAEVLIRTGWYKGWQQRCDKPATLKYFCSSLGVASEVVLNCAKLYLLHLELKELDPEYDSKVQVCFEVLEGLGGSTVMDIRDYKSYVSGRAQIVPHKEKLKWIAGQYEHRQTAIANPAAEGTVGAKRKGAAVAAPCKKKKKMIKATTKKIGSQANKPAGEPLPTTAPFDAEQPHVRFVSGPGKAPRREIVGALETQLSGLPWLEVVECASKRADLLGHPNVNLSGNEWKDAIVCIVKAYNPQVSKGMPYPKNAIEVGGAPFVALSKTGTAAKGYDYRILFMYHPGDSEAVGSVMLEYSALHGSFTPVQRGTTKSSWDSSEMRMTGIRIPRNTAHILGYYKKDPTGKSATKVANSMWKYLRPYCLNQLNETANSHRLTVQLGDARFTTMSLTRNYNNEIHNDDHDAEGLSAVVWMLCGSGSIAGGAFHVPQLGIQVTPGHGALIMMDTKTLLHGTARCQAQGGMERWGSALFIDSAVAKRAAKKLEAAMNLCSGRLQQVLMMVPPGERKIARDLMMADA